MWIFIQISAGLIAGAFQIHEEIKKEGLAKTMKKGVEIALRTPDRK